MPDPLLLDKSYLDGAPSASVTALCRDHSVMCSETLFYELMTTNAKSQVRCFSKLPDRPYAFALLPNLGTLLRFEIETKSPCVPLERHTIEGAYVFNPKFRVGAYVPEGEVLETLTTWREQVLRETVSFLERCQLVHQFFPELIGIEFRDFPAAVACARNRVGTDTDIVLSIYSSFSRDDLPSGAPQPEAIGPNWAWFRWVQCQILAALRIFQRYQCRVPEYPSPGVLERAEHSLHDMEYVILGSLAGAIASNDHEVIEDFRLVSPRGTLITTLAK